MHPIVPINTIAESYVAKDKSDRLFMIPSEIYPTRPLMKHSRNPLACASGLYFKYGPTAHTSPKRERVDLFDTSSTVGKSLIDRREQYNLHLEPNLVKRQIPCVNLEGKNQAARTGDILRHSGR